VSDARRDELFAHPGDLGSIQSLQTLGHDFVAHKRDELMGKFGNQAENRHMESRYQHASAPLVEQASHMGQTYQDNHKQLLAESKTLGVEMDKGAVSQFKHGTEKHLDSAHGKAIQAKEQSHGDVSRSETTLNQAIAIGKQNATRLPLKLHHNELKKDN